MRENSLDLGGATRTFARPQVRRPIPVNSRVGVGLGVLIGAVVLGGASFLSSCAQRTSGGASSDAPNTGLNALTQEPIDQTKQSGSETPGSSPSTPRDGDTQRPGVRPGTRLDKLAADTGVDVDNILASATPASRPAPEPRPEPAQSEPAPENPTPDAEDSSLPALPDSAPNTGLAALTGEDTGVTPDAGDSQTNEATAASAADQAAKEREAQLVKLGSLRRELAVFLDARRQQGAKAMSDAATIVIGDAIGYDGDATTGTKPAAPDESTMTSQERTTLSAIRTLGRALSQDGKVAEPARAVQLVEGVLSTLREAAAVRIARSALCTRVEGFGQYEPFADNTFVAGRTTKMIVYTEIENFSHRGARSDDPGMDTMSGADLVAVELSQELRLWHDADGSMQWRKPEQPIIEVGRNKRRDFFLVQQIELPPTLSVGKYNLKITIRDKVSGGVDERSIPIKIVADAGVIGKK
ncbi:MAG: hypothetical protein IT434_16355 [Phycisphaerales bacterium]|jgi:hypothetical protein|nr:hypothetical protein [Phycisphaerales bacterium]